jgi:hypothetical protein
MEWRECKTEIEQYRNMSIEEKELIVKTGMQSDFWKFLRSQLANTLSILETNLIRTRVNSLDDTMKLARFAEAYKTVEELFNTPDMILNAAILARRTPQSVKKGDK